MSFRRLDPTDARLAPSTDVAVALAAVAAAELDPSLEPVRRRITTFAAAHLDVLLRSCAAGHLTGSAVVVDHRAERSLVMLHAKIGRWFQPGGHADGDASLAGVALREATEETGIDGLTIVWPAVDADVHEVRIGDEPPHLHLDLRFLAIAPAGAVPVANHESRVLRWVDRRALDDLDPSADGITRRLVHRGLSVAGSLDP